jgi:hypothetical protein
MDAHMEVQQRMIHLIGNGGRHESRLPLILADLFGFRYFIMRLRDPMRTRLPSQVPSGTDTGFMNGASFRSIALQEDTFTCPWSNRPSTCREYQTNIVHSISKM